MIFDEFIDTAKAIFPMLRRFGFPGEIMGQKSATPERTLGRQGQLIHQAGRAGINGPFNRRMKSRPGDVGQFFITG